MKRSTALLLLSAFIACCSMSLAQSKAQSRRERWVATWATAQQLMPASFPGGRGGAPPQGGRGPQMQARPPPSAPSASQGVTPYQQQRSVPASIEDQTVRMIAHTTLGGRALRIEISNMANAQPLEIGSAHVALHRGDGAIVPGTDRVLKFSGNESFVVPPGALFLSDPVDLNLAPFSDLAISSISSQEHRFAYKPHDGPAHGIHLERQRDRERGDAGTHKDVLLSLAHGH